MGRFLHHTSCPKCGSKDNVAVYDDGYGYCFGCRKVVIRNEERFRKYDRGVRKSGVLELSLSLPFDFTLAIPERGYEWLNKYGLSAQEIKKHRIGWSESGWKVRRNTPNPIDYAPLMIFPIFDLYENLCMFQARYFGSSNELPKYWTKGQKGVFHILGEGSTIVLVEDLVSAIKVSREQNNVSCMPLFGSDISTDVIIGIYNRYPDLVIWLDKDKRSYARSRCLSVKYMFNSVKTIESELDPKEYSNEELQQFLQK